MDDATLTLLSRHLDGDLGSDETARLEERLAREPELRAELERLAEVTLWLGELASEEEPPEALDALVAPLRIEPASRPMVRPAFRWLAAAACVVIGVAVGLEVAQQHPPLAPSAPASAERDHTSSGEGAAKAPFQLQPLPSVADDEDLPVGAADRLLASPPPEAPLEEMRALEPVGPLEVDPEAEAQREAERKRVVPGLSRDKGAAALRVGVASAPAPDESGRPTQGVATAAPGPSKAAVAPPISETLQSRSGKEEAAWSGLDFDQAVTATLELWAPGGVHTAQAPVGESTPSGEYRVVVQVDDDGRVVDIKRTTGSEGGPSSSALASMLGLRFEGVAEGEHDGILSIPPPAPAPRDPAR